MAAVVDLAGRLAENVPDLHRDMLALPPEAPFVRALRETYRGSSSRSLLGFLAAALDLGRGRRKAEQEVFPQRCGSSYSHLWVGFLFDLTGAMLCVFQQSSAYQAAVA